MTACWAAFCFFLNGLTKNFLMGIRTLCAFKAKSLAPRLQSVFPRNVNTGMRWEMKHCCELALLYYF